VDNAIATEAYAIAREANANAQAIADANARAARLDAIIVPREQLRYKAELAAEAEQIALAQDAKKKAELEKLFKASREQSERREREGYPNGSRFNPALREGDPIPDVAWVYDDEATIRLYLRDSGFSDITDAQIAKIRDYMKAHQIRHVAQLGQ
jgi:hypothetical protein